MWVGLINPKIKKTFHSSPCSTVKASLQSATLACARLFSIAEYERESLKSRFTDAKFHRANESWVHDVSSPIWNVDCRVIPANYELYARLKQLLTHSVPKARRRLSAEFWSAGFSHGTLCSAARYRLLIINKSARSQFDSVHCVFCRVILTCN